MNTDTQLLLQEIEQLKQRVTELESERSPDSMRGLVSPPESDDRSADGQPRFAEPSLLIELISARCETVRDFWKNTTNDPHGISTGLYVTFSELVSLLENVLDTECEADAVANELSDEMVEKVRALHAECRKKYPPTE